MRARLTGLLVAAAVVAGCGGPPVPDDATSRAQITRAVLAWHRYQADANGKAGCALLTKRARYAQGGDDCARSIERYCVARRPDPSGAARHQGGQGDDHRRPGDRRHPHDSDGGRRHT